MFLILPKQIQRLDAENLQKHSILEKLLLQLFLKKRKPFAFSLNHFVKNLRNNFALARTGKLIGFYTSGIRDVGLLKFIQMA